MSIEVRQLVIKSTVGEEAEPSRGAAPALSREQLARVKAELLAEAKAWISEELRRLRER
jgi:uncharacterized circularly permuted ATP-grasp superfamily protein